MTFHNFKAGVMGILSEGGPAVPEFTGDPYNVVSFNIFPADAFAQIEVQGSGAIEQLTQSTSGEIGRWDGGAGPFLKNQYQFRLDTISGNIDSGNAVDTWLPASAGINFWRVTEVNIGIESFTGTLRVRLASSPFTEYDTASVSLNAQVEP